MKLMIQLLHLMCRQQLMTGGTSRQQGNVTDQYTIGHSYFLCAGYVHDAHIASCYVLALVR